MLRFYGRWLSMSLRRAFGVADGIGVALGTLAPIMVRSFPASESAVTELLWQIPLGIFASIGLVRLGRAPYWMYQERDEKARQMEIGLEARITELQARVAFKLQRQAICATLTKYRMQGDVLCLERYCSGTGFVSASRRIVTMSVTRSVPRLPNTGCRATFFVNVTFMNERHKKRGLQLRGLGLLWVICRAM